MGGRNKRRDEIIAIVTIVAIARRLRTFEMSFAIVVEKSAAKDFAPSNNSLNNSRGEIKSWM